MVVTEREPSPHQGQSPRPNLTPIKDGGSDVDAGISPLPPSRCSTDDRFSPGLGNCTDQELSDCPTPQTPPASLPFLQPIGPECETPPVSVPFPDPFSIGANEDSVCVLSEEGPKTIEEESCDSFVQKLENERDDAELLEQDECNYNTNREALQEQTEELSEIASKSEISQLSTEAEEISEQIVTCGESTEIFEESKETVRESKVETRTESYEQTVSVEKHETAELLLESIKEQIPLNQLWSMWSAEAPKVQEEIVETEISESLSAGQMGDKEETDTPKIDDQANELIDTTTNQPESGDELNDARLHLSDAQRRCHEMEMEIKRLENEREELSAAYREAETLRKQEEAKAQRLAAELAQMRHEYEKRLSIKEEELEALRKQMQIEIEQLSQRVAEAEAKVKTEVARIKKKMQIQITELEMSLDVANKQNIDMQKTIKKQSLQITELQAHYDEIHRQLQQTVDQLGVSQRRSQALQAEVEELRVTLEQTARAKRVTEQQLEEAQSRLNELNTINANLTSSRSKLEAEFMSLQADYEEINKELRISDERYNRVVIELKSTKDILIEEQERIVKIESIKKSLEIEVHNLQVRIEEVEANALAGGKRVLSKLEARIRDMEIELEEEKRRHGETQKILRKKEHRVKELIVQTEEDHQTITVLNDSVDKLVEKVKMYKRQLHEQEGMSQQNLTRVRRFQRELEAAEDRADQAESNLSLIRAKHRSWVTTSQVPGGIRQVIVTEEQTSSSSQY